MQYNPPFNLSGDASYLNGLPATGVEGGVIPAEAIEYTQREIVNNILKNQLSPTNGDLDQLSKAQQIDKVNWAEDTGTANHIIITPDPAPVTLEKGLKFWVLVKVTNTGTTDVNCGGIVKPLLTQGLVNLAAGVIVANGIAIIVYDGTQWQLMLGTAATSGPAGPKGDTGAAGAKGDTGDTGPAGPAGPKGDQGIPGPQGSPTSLIVGAGAVGAWHLCATNTGGAGTPVDLNGATIYYGAWNITSSANQMRAGGQPCNLYGLYLGLAQRVA